MAKAEAKKLWDLMLELEKEKPGVGEEKQAFFQNKNRKMTELKAKYDKETGLPNDPNDAELNQKVGDNQLFGNLAGQPDVTTKDSL